MSYNLSVICHTGAYRPRYQTRSAMVPCNDHTIPSLSVDSMWFCIRLFTSNAHCWNETSPFWMESPLNMLNFVFYLLPGRPHWGRKYGIVALEFAYVTAFLNLPLTQFLLSPPNVIDPPLTPTWVWQHHIQYLHCDPTTSQWIAIYCIFLSIFTFCEDQQSVLFIKVLYYHWHSGHMFID